KRSDVKGDDDQPVRDAYGRASHRFDVVYLRRWSLGTPYPTIVRDVSGLLARPEIAPADPRPECQPRLALDATGVGRPIFDLFDAADLPASLTGVLITGGDSERFEGSLAFVAKRHLVGLMQATLQTGRLKVVASLPLADVLKQEMMNFRVHISKA